MSRLIDWPKRMRTENNQTTAIATARCEASSEHSQCQHGPGMTTTWWPESNKVSWWDFAPGTTDWTTTCTANWSWCPLQPVPVERMTKHQSIFSRCVPCTKQQDQKSGCKELLYPPSSTAATESWKKRPNSSLELDWPFSKRTPRRRISY